MLTPREIAIHEAGHAVIALHFGWPITSVTISPDPESYGAANAPNLLNQANNPAEYKRRCWEGLVISLAGLAAQSEVSEMHVAQECASDDLITANTFAADMIGDVAPLDQILMVRKAGIRKAVRLVIQHEDAIERVADHLLAHTTIDGATLRDIVAGVGVDALEEEPV